MSATRNPKDCPKCGRDLQDASDPNGPLFNCPCIDWSGWDADEGVGVITDAQGNLLEHY